MDWGYSWGGNENDKIIQEVEYISFSGKRIGLKRGEKIVNDNSISFLKLLNR